MELQPGGKSLAKLIGGYGRIVDDAALVWTQDGHVPRASVWKCSQELQRSIHADGLLRPGATAIPDVTEARRTIRC